MNSQIERRQFWTAVHRYLGLFSLLFLGSAALTGVVLCFDRPLDATLNADLFRAPEAQRIEPLAAVRAFEAANRQVHVLAFPLRVRPGDALVATVAPRAGAGPLGYDQVFLDSSGGHLRGVRRSGPGWDRRQLIAGVYQFHYTLLAGTGGRWLMGLVALAWLIGNLVGMYLTVPIRRPLLRRWAEAWRFRMRSPTPRLLLDLHRASGLWVLIGVTALACTSVAMNFFDEVFTPLVTRVSPSRPSPFDAPPRAPDASPRVSPDAAVRIAVREGRRLRYAWGPARIAYDPDYADYRVFFTDDGFENYHQLGPISLHVDGRSGRVIHEDNPYTDSPGQKLSRALYPLHSGQVAGGVGVAVIVLLGAATLEMCATGAYLWWKRRRSRVAGRRARRARA